MVNTNYINSRVKLLFAIHYLGRYCKICGFDGFIEPWFMDFHHRNQYDKKYEISTAITSKFENIKEEVDKCDLLCGRCHRRIHGSMFRENIDEVFKKFYKVLEDGGLFTGTGKNQFSEKYDKGIIKLHSKGIKCSEIAKSLNISPSAVYRACKRLKLKIERLHPTNYKDEELVDLHSKNLRVTEISNILCVSEYAIYKGFKRLGLKTKREIKNG